VSTQHFVDLLSGISGSEYVLAYSGEIDSYGRDETLHFTFPFDILVRPGSPAEIGAIMKACNEYKVPVTPRGGGSGVTGGALPVMGGIVLSLERMNTIIGINREDSYVIAEAGVITADLCRAVEQEGLYFPVAPSSSAFSFIGGNVAENAGSIRSCRYGSTAQYVLNLEVVLPTGEIIWTGANVRKSATGIDLNHLFIGSEGILGIITKIVYRLLPIPVHTVFLLAGFGSLEDACRAIHGISRSNLSPSAVELICRNAMDITSAYLGGSLPLVKENIDAQLLIEVEVDNAVQMAEILGAHTTEDILAADTHLEKERLSMLRFNIGNAMTSGGKTYRDIDSTVPLSRLYDHIRHTEAVCRAHEMELVCFGHALDGNLHTMLMMDEAQGSGYGERLEKALHAIYGYALSNGGVISGEHGIGYLQKEFMSVQFTEDQLMVMRNIKRLFDPHHILNPGKIL
jgi:glycolate oxidase